jgi:hypothetical protein
MPTTKATTEVPLKELLSAVAKSVEVPLANCYSCS